MKAFCCIMFILICSNGSAQVKTIRCFRSIEELTEQLLNKNDSILDQYKNCYNILRLKDEEDEEESGLIWKKYQISKGEKTIVEVETSPLNISIIQRITVLDSSLKYLNNTLFVGQIFKNFKKLIKYAYWDEAHGVFFIKTDKTSNISIELNSEEITKFKKWELYPSKIPDNIQVRSIIITHE